MAINMKIKYVVGVYFLIVCILLGIGLYSKSKYVDLNKEETPLNHFTVGVLSDKLVDVSLEVFEEDLEEKNRMILAVKCIGKSKFYYGCTTQEVEVEKVFKGENIEKGNRIEIRRISAIFMPDRIKDNENMYANMEFVNEMQEGKMYLVFLDEKIKNSNIYVPYEEGVLKPVFCYDKIKNQPCPSTISEQNATEYENISMNEFFIASQRSIDKVERYKEEILQKYPYKQ
jgi:hypothetical protein